jgi:uncharacterized protein (TIGR00255 family)
MEVMPMIKSMTGYGRGDSSTDRMRFTVEIKSVNHRYNEVMVRMPREWLFVEEQIKKLVQTYLKRGRVDVFVTVHREEIPKKQLRIDWSLADAFKTAGKEMQSRYAFDDSERLGLKEILSLPDILQLVEEDSDLESQTPALLKALEAAVERLMKMRREEGAQLVIDMEKRLETLHMDVHQVSVRAPQVIRDARERLQQKIRDGLPEGITLDEGRLLTEVALMAERGDISEELTRLASHIKQFRNMMAVEEPVGRQLDFLVQEMNREVNTIGSKANDLEISQKVVLLKSELEKIREQVQNIE